VLTLLKQHWSPEQISGRLANEGVLRISHESIYRHIWLDKRRGGTCHKLLRQAGKKRRKRYGAYDSRGRLAGKRHISERPAAVDSRTQVGHWEIDTVLGKGKPCVVSLVERATGYIMIGKLRARTVAELNRATLALISKAPLTVRTITADNGTEFHGYAKLEAATGARFFFATPYHAWERGSSENANGLIRQYLPKRKSMARLTQARCDFISETLNTRPRKRFNSPTPVEERELLRDSAVLHFKVDPGWFQPRESHFWVKPVPVRCSFEAQRNPTEHGLCQFRSHELNGVWDSALAEPALGTNCRSPCEVRRERELGRQVGEHRRLDLGLASEENFGLDCERRSSGRTRDRVHRLQGSTKPGTEVLPELSGVRVRLGVNRCTRLEELSEVGPIVRSAGGECLGMGLYRLVRNEAAAHCRERFLYPRHGYLYDLGSEALENRKRILHGLDQALVNSIRRVSAVVTDRDSFDPPTQLSKHAGHWYIKRRRVVRIHPRDRFEHDRGIRDRPGHWPYMV
jgi:IS30 family transposase